MTTGKNAEQGNGSGLVVMDQSVDYRANTFFIYEARVWLAGQTAPLQLSLDAQGRYCLVEFGANQLSLRGIIFRAYNLRKDKSILELELDFAAIERMDVRVGDSIEMDLSGEKPVLVGVILSRRPPFAQPFKIPTSCFYRLGGLEVQS